MLDKIQESRPEWRAFTSDDSNNNSRTGTPSSLARHDMGFSTITGRADKDANGNRIDISMRSPIDREREGFRIQTHTPSDRNLREAFSELESLKDKRRLSDAIIEKRRTYIEKLTGAWINSR